MPWFGGRIYMEEPKMKVLDTQQVATLKTDRKKSVIESGRQGTSAKQALDCQVVGFPSWVTHAVKLS